ncbi:BRO family protein [Peribacillus muralis]|uniref:BRO family protein n=1 Tax=Peribacillus muralis TaxID=264697 RepID=UPI003D05030E
MNQLQKVFNYGENPVRTVMKGDDIWFVLTDVCKVLELSTPSRVKERLEDGVSSTHIIEDSIGRPQNTTIINEDGLYDVILESRKPEAKMFRKWITGQVLPSIRKHGAYMTDDVLEKTLHDPDYMIGLLTALKEEKVKRVEAETTVSILTHVNKTYTATEIAKELGFKSAIALNKDLQSRKLQFQQNGTWVFYSKYADKGYVEIKQDVLDNGKVIYHRRFTQIGREFLIRLYGLEQKNA